MVIYTYTPSTQPEEKEFGEINDFLFEHLDQYGDSQVDIAKAMRYSLGEDGRPGGFVLCAKEGNNIIGAVVVNQTGMNGYIPDNILVYIATHRDQRGRGIGRQLMRKAIETASGDVALHVEPDNPAKVLYEQLGFKNKYLEMRLTKTS